MQVYKTRGVCSQAIQFELDGDTIKHVNFIGGCSGNTQGVGVFPHQGTPGLRPLVDGNAPGDGAGDLRVAVMDGGGAHLKKIR